MGHRVDVRAGASMDLRVWARRQRARSAHVQNVFDCAQERSANPASGSHRKPVSLELIRMASSSEVKTRTRSAEPTSRYCLTSATRISAPVLTVQRT